MRARGERRDGGLRPGAVDGQNSLSIGETGAPRLMGCGFQRTRASANTSGPDFTWAFAGEIADRKDPHRTKKTCFFCRTGFQKSELPGKYDPAV